MVHLKTEVTAFYLHHIIRFVAGKLVRGVCHSSKQSKIKSNHKMGCYFLISCLREEIIDCIELGELGESHA